MRKSGIFILTGLVLVTLFQNCGGFASFEPSPLVLASTAPGEPKAPVEPVVPVEPPTEPVIVIAPKPISALLLTSLANEPIPSCVTESTNTITQKTFTYKEVDWPLLSRRLHLRAYVNYPPGYDAAKKYPVVAFFHGGAWIANTPVYHFPMAWSLASRGAVTVNFQYRIGGVFSSSAIEAVKDAKSAIRWLRKFSTELGIDKDQILAVGDSAGGHLVLATATELDFDDEVGAELSLSAKPSAVVALYPVVDTTTDIFKTLQKLSVAENRRLSPIHHIVPERLPPTLLMHGELDTGVPVGPKPEFAQPLTPLSRTKEFCDLANASGERCWFLPFAGEYHAFIETQGRSGAAGLAPYRLALQHITSFLADLNYLNVDRSQLSASIASSAYHCNRLDYLPVSLLNQSYGYSSTPALQPEGTLSAW